MTQKSDSPEYLRRKAFFNSLITVFGRKPVLEALLDPELEIYRLHLADSNKSGGIIAEIEQQARLRGVEIQRHSRSELSRISRNAKQDQGVACDIICTGYQPWENLQQEKPAGNLIALDGVTNPQNLGMIIRSVTASPAAGILLPQKGCAALSPLVIKASAGTLFKSTIYRCDSLVSCLKALKQIGYQVAILSSHQAADIGNFRSEQPLVYVLGNETEGVSEQVAALADHRLCIPMANGVESLNVAVTAALVAFRG